MSYRKGELTKAKILRDWPHHVEIPIPEGGLSKRFDAMDAFCRDRDHKTTGAGHRPMGQDAMLWCFRSKEDADAFAMRFGGNHWAAMNSVGFPCACRARS